MQLFLGAVPVILKLFSEARGHLLFSNYSGIIYQSLPKCPVCFVLSLILLLILHYLSNETGSVMLIISTKHMVYP